MWKSQLVRLLSFDSLQAKNYDKCCSSNKHCIQIWTMFKLNVVLWRQSWDWVRDSWSTTEIVGLYTEDDPSIVVPRCFFSFGRWLWLSCIQAVQRSETWRYVSRRYTPTRHRHMAAERSETARQVNPRLEWNRTNYVRQENLLDHTETWE